MNDTILANTPCALARAWALIFLFYLTASPCVAQVDAWNVGTAQQDCVMESASQTMSDGYGDARVQLRLDASGLRVVTDSEIDTGLAGNGIAVDGGPLTPFSRLEGLMTVVIDQDTERLVEEFRRGRRVEVRLHFWPGWPITGIKTVEFSLMGFTRASTLRTRCLGEPAEQR